MKSLNVFSILLLVAFTCSLALGVRATAQTGTAQTGTAEVDSTEAIDAGTGGDDDDSHSDGETESHGDSDHGGEHGGGEHELDPTHMNLSDSGEDAAEWRSEKAISTLIVFGLMLLGLTAFAWKPIAAGLEKRESTIANNIASAEKAKADAATKLAEYEQKISSANEEAQQIVAQARKDAEAAGQKLIAGAQEEAVRSRERAVADIEAAKVVALGELTNQSTDLAMSLARSVVGREVKAEDHQGLIQELLSKMPSNN